MELENERQRKISLELDELYGIEMNDWGLAERMKQASATINGDFIGSRKRLCE